MRSTTIVGEYAAYFIAVKKPEGKLRMLRNSLLVIGASLNSYFFPSNRVRIMNPSQLYGANLKIFLPLTSFSKANPAFSRYVFTVPRVKKYKCLGTSSQNKC